jgi:hypothetical protein
MSCALFDSKRCLLLSVGSPRCRPERTYAREPSDRLCYFAFAFASSFETIRLGVSIQQCDDGVRLGRKIDAGGPKEWLAACVMTLILEGNGTVPPADLAYELVAL